MPKEKLDPNLAWLVRTKDYIRIKKLEVELDMPEGTLKKFVDDRRGLPAKWHDPVIKRVKELRSCK
jgi:hypothetical protein